MTLPEVHRAIARQQALIDDTACAADRLEHLADFRSGPVREALLTEARQHRAILTSLIPQLHDLQARLPEAEVAVEQKLSLAARLAHLEARREERLLIRQPLEYLCSLLTAA